MTAIAVNCLLNDARRKLVCSSILWSVRRSVTPYPRSYTTRPFWITITAAPGAEVPTVRNREAILAARSRVSAARAKAATMLHRHVATHNRFIQRRIPCPASARFRTGFITHKYLVPMIHLLVIHVTDRLYETDSLDSFAGEDPSRCAVLPLRSC